MRELRHLILHGLVSAFVRAMPYTLLLDRRAAEAAPILGTSVEPI